MSDRLKKTESASNSEFESVLDRELGRILDGQASIDDCCAANSQYAEELRPLLQLAISARSALIHDEPTVLMADTAMSEGVTAREKIMAHAGSMNDAGKSGRNSRSRLGLRPMALASGLFVILFAGTALAAGTADPDSALYPLKQRMESARTTLAMQELDQARSEANHANKRLDELQAMMDKGKTEYTAGLLAKYEAHINAASDHAAAAAAEGEDTADVEAYIASVRGRHDEMLKSLGLEEPDDEGDEAGSEGRSPAVDDDGDSSEGSGGAYPGDSGGAPAGDNEDGDSDSHGSGSSGGGDDSGDNGRQDDSGGSDDDGHPPSDGGNEDESSNEESSHRETPKQNKHDGDPAE